MLTVVLPAYNEEEAISGAIEQCDRLVAVVGRPIECIVVNDGSSDRTGDMLVEAIKSRSWLRVISHDKNGGYGAALTTGFHAARGSIVFYTDADSQFDLLDVVEVLPLMDRADMVTGFRVYRYDPLGRLFISWCYNRLVRVLFRVKVRDVDCSFKVMRRSKLDQLTLMSTDFFIDTELVARARKWNWRIAELGVKHYPRPAGKSTVRPGDIPRTLRAIGKMWLAIYFPRREAQHERWKADERRRTQLRAPSSQGTPQTL